MFSNGIINCNGKASSKREGYKPIRKYARLLHNCGYPVNFSDAKLLTMSMSQSLSSDLDLKRLSFDRDVVYEPKLFPSLNFKRKGVHFCCFHTGKVLITGVTAPQQEDEVVCPTLIELELYTRKKESVFQRFKHGTLYSLFTNLLFTTPTGDQHDGKGEFTAEFNGSSTKGYYRSGKTYP